MHRLIVCATFLLAGANSGAGAADDPLTALKKGQPTDVAAIIDRMVGCSHFSGEEGYDAQRRREIETAMNKMRCDRVGGDERKIRQRYARSPEVLKALKKAEEWDN